jgi:hypothetical protein
MLTINEKGKSVAMFKKKDCRKSVTIKNIDAATKNYISQQEMFCCSLQASQLAAYVNLAKMGIYTFPVNENFQQKERDHDTEASGSPPSLFLVPISISCV